MVIVIVTGYVMEGCGYNVLWKIGVETIATVLKSNDIMSRICWCTFVQDMASGTLKCLVECLCYSGVINVKR